MTPKDIAHIENIRETMLTEIPRLFLLKGRLPMTISLLDSFGMLHQIGVDPNSDEHKDLMAALVRGFHENVGLLAVITASEAWVVSGEEAASLGRPSDNPLRREQLIIAIETPLEDTIYTWDIKREEEDGPATLGDMRTVKMDSTGEQHGRFAGIIDKLDA
jgi:hypothetical protein